MNIKLAFSILNGFAYSILGSIILMPVINLQMRVDMDMIIEFFGIKSVIKPAVWHNGFVGLGLFWTLPGLFISAFTGNLAFQKSTDLFSRKWLFIIISASILPIILAQVFLPFLTDLPIRIDSNLVFWLFFALFAFTFIYVKLPLAITKRRKTNSLK